MRLFSPATPVLNYGRLVNQASPLNRGLVSWWLTLPQGGKGDTFFDICGKNHGDLTGGPTWVGSLGRPGGYGAIDFDATDDYALITAKSLAGVLTYCAWIYPDTLAANFESASGHFVVFGTAGGNDSVMVNQTSVAIRTLGTDVPVVTNPDFTTGSWQHLCLTRDSADLVTVYRNGVSAGTATASGSMEPIHIGRRSSFYADGRMDDVRTFEVCKSASEVWQLYNDSRQGYPTTLNRIRLPVLGGAAAPDLFWPPVGQPYIQPWVAVPY